MRDEELQAARAFIKKLDSISDPLEAIKFIDEKHGFSYKNNLSSSTAKELRLLMLSEKARIIKQKLRGKKRQEAIRSFFNDWSFYEHRSYDLYRFDTLCPYEILNTELLPYLVDDYHNNTAPNHFQRSTEASNRIKDILNYVFPQYRTGKKPFRGNKKKAFQAIVLAKMQAPMDNAVVTNHFFEHAIQICPKGLESWFLDIVELRGNWEKHAAPRPENYQTVYGINLKYVYNFYKRENLDPETRKRAREYLSKTITQYFGKTHDVFQYAITFLENQELEPEVIKEMELALIKVLESAGKNKEFQYFSSRSLKELRKIFPELNEKAAEYFYQMLNDCIEEKNLRVLNSIGWNSDIPENNYSLFMDSFNKVILSLNAEDVSKVVNFLMQEPDTSFRDSLEDFLVEYASPQTINPEKLYSYLHKTLDESRVPSEKRLFLLKTLIQRLEGALDKGKYFELVKLYTAKIKQDLTEKRKRISFKLGKVFEKGRILRPKRRPGNRKGRRTFRLGRVVQ